MSCRLLLGADSNLCYPTSSSLRLNWKSERQSSTGEGSKQHRLCCSVLGSGHRPAEEGRKLSVQNWPEGKRRKEQ